MASIYKFKFNLFNVILVLMAIKIAHFSWTNLYISVDYFDVLIFLSLASLSEVFSINLPKYGNVSVTFAIDLAAILLFGPFVASLLGGASYLFKDFLKKDFKLYKFIFNASQIIITINIAGLIYFYAGGNFTNIEVNNITPILLSALAYSNVNLTLFSMGFSILMGVSFRDIWTTNIKSVLANFFALIPLGIIIAYLYQNIGIFAVVLFFIPLLLARHTFKLYMDMREMYLDTISSLAATIDAKDEYTLGHSDRVSQYTIAIAKEMKLPEDDIENLKYIALLHDIGKIAVPEAILNKPDKLTDNEYDIMKYHAEYGAEIVRKIKFLKGYEIIRAHHERIDGGGYPDNICGDAIPLAAKIIAVADSFDAMTSDRPYRKALTTKFAFLELEKCSGKQFDGEVVGAFKRVYPSIEIAPSDREKFLLPKELQEKLKQLSGGASIAL